MTPTIKLIYLKFILNFPKISSWRMFFVTLNINDITDSSYKEAKIIDTIYKRKVYDNE